MTTAVDIFNRGGVIAYPTEAVFGLGCDPDNQHAIEKLLKIKQRPIEKGLILLAGNIEQLLPYIDRKQISDSQFELILSRWPNGITQVLPAHTSLSEHLTGKFNTIAVRVTNQPDVVTLCKEAGKPIVSTSANLSGQSPARTWQTLDADLLPMIDFVIKAETLNFLQPSTIIDGLTGEVFRT